MLRFRFLRLESSSDEAIVERLESGMPNAEETTSDEERRDAIREAVQEAVASLPNSQRDVVKMHKLDGLSMREISEKLDVREGTLRVRAHRAYKALAERLSAFAPAVAR